MQPVRRVLCAAMCAGVLAAIPAQGATYGARISFEPSDASDIAGYNVYVRSSGEAYASPQDAGLPAPDEDGLLRVVVGGLDVRRTYVVAATAYVEGGSESDLSNEVSIGYTDVAPFVDSDGDGLTDAAEDVNLNQVVDPGETDPEDPDTDDDGILDGSDRCQGSSAGTSVDELGCESCATLLVRKLGFERGRTRDRLLGRAVVALELEIDPTISGVVLELIDAAGGSLYRGEVPGVAFAKDRARRVFKFRGGHGSKADAQAKGLKKLVFKQKQRRTAVVAEAATADLAEAVDTPSLTWFIRSGNTCMRALQLTCRSTSRRATRCR